MTAFFPVSCISDVAALSTFNQSLLTTVMVNQTYLGKFHAAELHADRQAVAAKSQHEINSNKMQQRMKRAKNKYAPKQCEQYLKNIQYFAIVIVKVLKVCLSESLNTLLIIRFYIYISCLLG